MLVVEIPEDWCNERKWIAQALLGRYVKNLTIKIGRSNQWRITHASMPGEILVADTYFSLARIQKSLYVPKPFDQVNFLTTKIDGHEYKLPILFGGLSEEYELTSHKPENSSSIRIDVFGICFWVMARVEEHYSTERDSHDRFSAYSSHAHKNGYLLSPVVDQFAQFLFTFVIEKWPCIKYEIPKFKMYISHDVDIPYLYKFTSFIKASKLIARYSIQSKSPEMLMLLGIKNVLSRLEIKCADPCDTFEWLMDESDKAGVRSEFYFIPSNGLDPKDADYQIDNPKIIELLRSIKSRGHIVGLHPSYATYCDPDLMTHEVAALKNAVYQAGFVQSEIGGRMHFLRWHHEKTPTALIQAGVSYDSTMGYADYPGFRAGTCHEYFYFDLTSGKVTELRMRPLIAMEATIMAKRYLGLGVTNEAVDLFSELKIKCRQVGGVFGLLWHNSSLFLQEERKIYSSVLNVR